MYGDGEKEGIIATPYWIDPPCLLEEAHKHHPEWRGEKGDVFSGSGGVPVLVASFAPFLYLCGKEKERNQLHMGSSSALELGSCLVSHWEAVWKAALYSCGYCQH